VTARWSAATGADPPSPRSRRRPAAQPLMLVDLPNGANPPSYVIGTAEATQDEDWDF